ncbi:MAG TPA: galactokinase [Candidatus Cloacimonetes bacterium]|nr:galactokinase [Candidatus Cloacimonadota bacterium]
MKKENLIKHYKAIYKKSPAYIIRAPGRVNLIGEHTDYNDGFVLPIAIDRYTNMLVSKNDDRKIRLYDLKYKEKEKFDLANIRKSQQKKWSNYQRGIAKILLDAGYKIGGMDILIFGEVSEGAGLSSSASIEIATLLSFKELYDLEIKPLEMITLARKAENEFVGVQCGIMDQFTSLLSKEGNALFIDCRNLKYQYVPLSIKGYSFLVCNSMKKRKLADSSYNERRQECVEAVKILQKNLPGITFCRDISINNFEKYKSFLPEKIKKRVEHVVFENDRVQKAVKVLKKGNAKAFGELMYQSHKSLKELYEVSTKELDLLVEIGKDEPGVLGARLTGAGFGGCVIYLVKDSCIENLKANILDVYSKKTGLIPQFYKVVPSDGAISQKSRLEFRGA